MMHFIPADRFVGHNHTNIIEDYRWIFCLEAAKGVSKLIRTNPENFDPDFPRGLEGIAEELVKLVKNGQLVIDVEQQEVGMLFCLVRQ